MNPEYSIVVATRERPEALEACLQALAELESPAGGFEVVVVHDGDSDANGAAPNALQLRRLRQTHRGPARARNAGAEVAKGRYIVFTDDDCLPARDWLLRLAQRLEDAPGRAVAGRTANGLPENTYAVTSQLLVDYLNAYYNRDPAHARFATANNLALPRSLFEEIGGFDGRFELNAAEDRDLSYRLSRRGSLVFAPDAVIYHSHRLSLTGFLGQHFRYGRGAFHFHALHRSRPRLEPLRFYRDLARLPLHSVRPRARATAALLLLTQLATAAGYAYELLARPPRRALPQTARSRSQRSSRSFRQ